MAEDSNKEQLEIQAKLDTSQLKREAKQGLNDVVKEEKKVEQQSKQTSKAIDDIGQSGKKVGHALQQAGNAGTQAMRQVGNEATKTKQKIDEIAKAAKGINIKQGIGIATQVMGQLAPYGREVGSALGFSDKTMDVQGGLLTGAASGAALGTMIMPGVGTAIGMVAGALAGAGTELLNAGKELREAAKEQKAQVIGYQNAWRMQEDADAYSEKVIGSSMVNLTGMRDEEQGKLNKLIEERKKLQDIEVTEKNAKEINRQILQNYVERQIALQRISAIEEEIAKRLERQKKTTEDTNKPAQKSWFDKFSEQAAQNYFDDVAKWQNENRRDELRDSLRKNEDLIKSRESFIDKLGSTKLTDSMVKMGAGGYGIQMQGINTYVRSMSTSLEAMRKASEDILTTIRSINDKYTPYNGEFI